MILEEVVAFSEEVDAVEYVSFLKSKGCRARIEVRGNANAEELLEGALDDLIAWFEEAAAQSGEEPPELSDDARWFLEGAEKYRRQRDQIADECPWVEFHNEPLSFDSVVEKIEKRRNAEFPFTTRGVACRPLATRVRVRARL